MKHLRLIIGRAALIFGWPVLWVYFRVQPSRTRVVVVYDTKILMVRSWVGSGKFGLPGGGLHRGEDERVGAVRELQEETGIRVQPSQLIKFMDLSQGDHGFTYTQHCYYVFLQNNPAITLQKNEIIDYVWLDFTHALEKAGNTTAAAILGEFSNSANFDTL